MTKTYFPPTPRNYRNNISKAKRRRVFERDERRCKICGSRDDLTIDHVRAITNGGTNRESNLQTLCYTCNHAKCKQEQKRRLHVWVDWRRLGADGRIWTTRTRRMPQDFRPGGLVTLYSSRGLEREARYLGYCQTGTLPAIYWFEVVSDAQPT